MWLRYKDGIYLARFDVHVFVSRRLGNGRSSLAGREGTVVSLIYKTFHFVDLRKKL